MGRFNNMDALSELAPSQTPYRYGFNNPVYWTDPTGLFENRSAAFTWANTHLSFFRIIDNGDSYSVWSGGVTYYMFEGMLVYDFYAAGSTVLDAHMISGISPDGLPIGGSKGGGGGSSSGSSGNPSGNGPGGPSGPGPGAGPGGPSNGAGPGGPGSSGSNSSSTPIENLWNSPIMRFVVPDKISISFAAEWAFFVGADVSTLNFTLLTRGEVGVYYTPSFSARIGAGSYASAGINVSTGYFTGDPSTIKASMLQGHTAGVVLTGAYIGKASLGASYSPTKKDFSQGFINMDVGIGLGAGPAAGAGAFGGVQYQNTLGYGTIWKWH